MRVYLEGTYGIDNFGDDMLCVLFSEWFKNKNAKLSICGDWSNNSGYLKSYIKENNFEFVHRNKVKSKIKAIKESDLIVIGGGGQFNDNSSRTGGSHLVITFALAKIMQKKIIVGGTGFGPLNKKLPRFIWPMLYKGNIEANFRDADSVKEFSSLCKQSANLVNDPAYSNFGIEYIKRCASESEDISNLGILVNLRNFRYNQNLETMLEKIILNISSKEKIGISFACADLKDDLNPESSIFKYLQVNKNADSNLGFYDYNSPSELIQFISKSSIVITQRFHVLCVCLVLGVPVIPVCYANKMTELCDKFSIPYIDVRDSLNAIVNMNGNDGEFVTYVDNILNKKHSYVEVCDFDLDVFERIALNF